MKNGAVPLKALFEKHEMHTGWAVIFSMTHVSRFLVLCLPYVLRYWACFSKI